MNLKKETKIKTQEIGHVGPSLLDKQENFSRTLHNRRSRKLPPVPKTEQDLREIPVELFPERFTSTASGEKFLILNTSNVATENIILGFASPSQLELLKTSVCWYADGTSDCVSSMEYLVQLWIIIADTSTGVSVPCAFFLTAKRTQDVYERILRVLRDECGVGPPKNVLCDLEMAS